MIYRTSLTLAIATMALFIAAVSPAQARSGDHHERSQFTNPFERNGEASREGQ